MFKVKDGIRIGAQEFVDGSRNVTAGTVSASDVTISGELRGPATMYIDPAGIGDNTGTLVIRGNLQVDGTTTTINSTTVAIDDLNLQLATDAPNAAAADGAGITIGGAGATFTYVSSGDKWQLNKSLEINGNQVWHAGNLTNLNQLTNGPGYITGYTETDTLATVTARGASTSNSVTLSGTGNQFGGHFYFLPWDSAGNHYPHFNDGGNASGSKVNWRLFTGGTNSITHYWDTGYTYFANRVESASDMRATLYYDATNTSYYLDPAAGFYLFASSSSAVINGTESSSGLIIQNNSTGGPKLSLKSTAASGKDLWFISNNTSNTDGAGRLQLWNNSDGYTFATFGTTAGANHFIYGAYTQMSGSARAPIFYDSDNTGYYVDPASTSNLSGLTVSNAISGNVTGYSKWIDRVPAYQWSNSTLPSGYNSGVETSFVSSAEGWPQYGVVLSVMGRVPVDPGGNFQLFMGHGASYGGLGLRVRSINQTNNLWTSWKILLDETNYTNYAMPIGSSATNSVDIRAPIFYDSADTGYYVDPNNTSRLAELRVGGGPGGSTAGNLYIQGNNDWRWIAGHVPNYGVGNGFGLYSDSLGYYLMSLSTSGNWYFGENNHNSSHRVSINGTGYASGDFRSPIFYDSNDTAYYTDPASTSRLNSILPNEIQLYAGKIQHGSGSGGTSFGGGHYSQGMDIANGYSSWSYPYKDYIIGHHTGIRIGGYYNYGGTRFYNNSPTTDADMNGHGDGGETLLFSTGMWDNNVRSHVTLYAPFIYDLDDTNYYLDPNSGSRLLHIFAGNVSSSNDGSWNARMNLVGSAHARLDVVSNSDGIITTMYSHTGQGVGKIGTMSNHPLTLMAQGANDGGYVYNGSIRSPIFYDANDTNYYLDPASTSRLNTSRIGNINVGSGTYLNTITPIGDGNINLSAPSGAFYFDTWPRMPGLYDINDTAYYVDPNSNSKLVNLGLGGATPDVRLSISGDAHVSGFLYMAGTAGSAGSWGSRDYTSGSSRYFNANYYEFNNVGYGSTWSFTISSGDTTSSSSSRAPIFYDSNNTAYYTDPASTSRLNSITIDDGNVQLYKPQTVDMSNTSTYSTSNYYPVTIQVPTGGCWIEIQNNLNSNVPSWATHPSGFTLNLRWWTNGSSWGTTEVKRRVEQYHERFTNLTICGGITQMIHSSTEVVWLRGGGTYYFYFSRNLGATAQSSTYSINSQSVSPTSSAQNSVWDSASGAHTSYNTRVDADSQMRSPIYYDYNDTGYYVDPGADLSFRTAGYINLFRNDVQAILQSQNTSAGSPAQFNLRHSYGDVVLENYRGGILEYATAVQTNNSYRAPIFYDSNDTGYYFDGTGGTRQSRFLTISGGATGIYGNELVVGATAVQYSLQDTNQRAIIQAHGAYPVISLNHTVTSNTQHGPTIQFTSNGTGHQFVIGTNGTGTMLSMGYSSAGDWNPHNGISGYNGTSFFHVGTNGYIGIGSEGDWTVSGGSGTHTPGYNLHFIGSNNAVNGHAAFFDNRVSATNNGSGFLFRNLHGNHSWGVVAEYRIDGAGDRPSILFSSNQVNTSWSVGFVTGSDDTFRITKNHGHRAYYGGWTDASTGWGAPYLTINTSGNVTAPVDMRSPIFYDSNDTSYYLDPNSTSFQRSLFLGAHDSGTSEFRFGEDSSGWYGDRWYWDSQYTAYRYSRYAGTDSLIHYHDTRDATRITYGRNIVFDDYGKGIVGVYSSYRYQGVFAMGDSYKLPADGTTTGSLYGLAWSHPNAGGTAGNLNTHGLLVLENGGFLAAVSGSIRARDDMRAPIFYEINNTGYYVDPGNNANIAGQVYIGGWFRNYGQQGLYNESYGNHWYATGNDYWNLAGNNGINVGIIFRTGGHQGTSRGYVYADSSNNIGFLNSGASWRLRVVGDDYSVADGSSMRAQIFYDSNDTTYYLDPNSTTSSLKIAGAIELGENHAFPNVEWSSSGSSTGMIIFKLPGGSGNYGMVHMVFDYYEYNSPRTATIIVGGHNWNSAWYNNSCNVVGFIDKQVRLGFKDGQYCVVIGTSGSEWNYGTVRLRKIHNASFYNNAMDLGGSYSVAQTTTESFTNITSDLRNFRTPTALQVDGILQAYTDVRTPIVYDQNDTNYYCDPNGSSRLNDVFPNQIYNYGWFRNQNSATGLYNTATDSHFYSAGANYWHINPDNGSVSVGGLIFYDQFNSTQNSSTGRKGSIYWDSAGFGLLDSTGNWTINLHPTNYRRVTIGGYNGLNPYSSVDGIRLMFGGGDDNAAGSYYIGTNFENYGGTYTKLDLRWHTGIRMGAQPGYGGIRFYNNEGLETIRFSINKGDEHTRVESGSFYSNLMYDRDNTAYYVDPASTSRLLKLRVNTANDPSDNAYGTATDIPMYMSGSTRTQSTFLIENTSNSFLEYPVIVIRRTQTPTAARFGSFIRFADRNSGGNDVLTQIFTYNRQTSQDLNIEASSSTGDRVIITAGSSSNIYVGENYVFHLKAANYNGITPGALDIDCRQGNYFTKTIAGNSTFTFSNVTSLSGYTLAYSFTLEVTHTSGTITWPSTVKWPGNTAPSLTTGKTHLFMFVTDDAGSRWRGSYLTNYDN